MSQYSIVSNCIAASAGTGKTYRLVSRYIALLCLGERPDALIALTFTNKAAGEFRNRILDALAEGAGFDSRGGTLRNPLAARVMETVFGKEPGEDDPAETIPLAAGITPQLKALAARDRAEELPEIRQFFGHALDSGYFCSLLEKVVEQLAALQLSTMDSFFQKLVSQHLMELGLGEVSPLMDDDEELAQREAVMALVDSYDKDEASRLAFIELCRDVTGNKLRSIVDSLSGHVRDNHSLLEVHPDEADWHNYAAFGLPDATKTPPPTEEEWTALIDEFMQCRDAVWDSLKKAPQNSLNSFLGKMANRNFNGLVTLEKYLDNDEFSSPDHLELKARIRKIMDLVREDMLRDAQKKTQGMYRLLSVYQDVYNRAVKSTGRMTFEEMTQEAQRLFEGSAREELGQRYRHWLLDEFQDTNGPQWESLKGLLDEVVMDSEAAGEHLHRGRSYHTAERSLFVVGDRKQGIYGFRGSIGRLFSVLHGDEPARGSDAAYQEALVPSSLSLSYRSARSIMGGRRTGGDGLVNTIFSGIDDDNLQDFRNHDTTREARGYVQLRFLPPGGNVKELRAEAIPAAIVQILRDDLTVDGAALKRDMTVAVLVRTNAEAAAIVDYLHRALPGLPVQLVGTTDVAAASAIGEMLMSLFLWLHHPADSYRLSIVRLSPMGAFWQEGEGDAAVHAGLLEMLDAAGYAALLRDRVMPLFHEVADDRAFDEWLTAAVEFDAAGGSLAGWIDFMRARSTRAAATTRAVQVMTMHKSKGLEFDAVILPFSRNKGIDDVGQLRYMQTDDAVMAIPDRVAFSDAVLPVLEVQKEHKRREAYNLLYVACSRAKYANYLIMYNCAKPDSEKKDGKDLPCVYFDGKSEAAIVAHSLLPGKYGPSTPEYSPILEGGVVYERGTREWYAELQADVAKKEAEKAKEAQPHPAPPAEPKPLGTPAVRRRKVSPSKLAEEEPGHEPPAQTPASAIDYGDGRSAADFGTAVHALFEQVEWLEDGVPLPFAPGDSAESGIVCAALQEPGIAALFQRNGDQVAYAEQDIDAIDSLNGKEVWVSGTIDRLVLTMQGGTVAAASIIDFKTDKRRGPTPQDEDSALRERHFPQMKAYHNLVCTAFNLPSHKVTVTLVSCPANAASPRAIPYPPDTQW